MADSAPVRPAGAPSRHGPPAGRADLRALLVELARSYPERLVPDQLSDVERTEFHIGLLLEHVGPRARIADIGAGIGIFTLACARLGMQVLLVDDFRDPINLELGESILGLHRKHGVEVLSRDVMREPLGLAAGSLDAVTTFNSIEHLHHSPKRLLHELLAALRPGGLFLLSGPNAVNLRKRVAVPLGLSNWSAFEDYYENPVFRGHVREPCVADLRRIAADLRLKEPVILGRNWQGHGAGFVSRWATRLSDRPLRLVPSLCRELYLVGRKEG